MSQKECPRCLEHLDDFEVIDVNNRKYKVCPKCISICVFDPIQAFRSLTEQEYFDLVMDDKAWETIKQTKDNYKQKQKKGKLPYDYMKFLG